MTDVKRYRLEHEWNKDIMVESPDGRYVLYGDYATLTTAHQQVVHELGEQLRLAKRISFDVKDGNVWYWADDEYDHLESLVCPIVVTPEKLREWKASIQQAVKERDECLVKLNQVIAWRKADEDMIKGQSASLQQAVEALAGVRKALQKYGQHGTSEHVCAASKHSDWACDCGLAVFQGEAGHE